MNRERPEVAVGGFLLVTMLLLFWGTLQIGGFPSLFGTSGKTFIANFENAAGLELEADVMIAGVPVGKVDAVGLAGLNARVTLRVDDPALAIPEDSVVAIRSRGLLGERVIEIVPGRSENQLPDGGVFTRSQAVASVDVLIDRINDLAGDFKSVSATFRNVFGTAEGEEALHEMLANMRTVTTDLKTVVEANAEGVGRIVRNLDSFSTDLAGLTEGDPSIIEQTLTNLHQTSAKLDRTLSGIVRLSEKVERGEGTLGKLLTDEELYNEVEAAVADVRGALREVRRAAEETQEQIPATILTTVFGSLF